jgi:hypothetical protein
MILGQSDETASEADKVRRCWSYPLPGFVIFLGFDWREGKVGREDERV